MIKAVIPKKRMLVETEKKKEVEKENRMATIRRV